MPYCPECSAYVPEKVDVCPTCGASLVPTPRERSEPAAPTPLDTEQVAGDLRESLASEYQFLKLIGVGGMGAVFLLREIALKRLVAVKVLAPSLAADASARARFTREARAAAALSHPNVVRVYAVGETAALRLPFIVMQYVEGPSLADWMQQHPRATERDARRVIGEVAAGLAAAHARNLLHRDVKPGNVLLEAESSRAYVADFGVSAALGAGSADTTGSLTATGHVVGTPIYMSPEQAAGEPLSPKSDVYSLGVLAYELLVGELPFKAATAMGWAAAHLRDTPTPVGHRRADLSPDVARLVDRCVAKDPADRPLADEVARGMLPTLASEIEWPPPGLHWLHGRSRTLSRLALATFVGAILTLTALAFTPQILQPHSNWLWRFQGSPGALRQDPAAVSLFLWQTELILGVSILALSLSAFLALGAGALRRLIRLRGLGWHWGTLADIAADHDGRSGLVLSGAREFASLEAHRRLAILTARRWRAGALLGTVVWLLIVVGVWGAMLLTGSLTAAGVALVVSARLWLMALGPPLLGVLAVGLARLAERRLTGPLGRARRIRDTDTDAAAWYEALPGGGRVAHPARRALRRYALAGQIVAAALAFVLVVTIGEAVAASVTAVLSLQRLGPKTALLVGDQDRVETTDPMRAARLVWVTLIPPSDSTADSTGRAWVRALASPAAPGGSGLAPYAEKPSDVLGHGKSMSQVFDDAAAGALSRSLLDTLAGLAADPRTRLLRRLARVTPTSTLMASLENLSFAATEGQSGDARAAPTSEMHEAALANTAGAVVALAAHDLAGASARIGENAAFAEQLLRAPDVRSNALGFRILRNLVIEPLSVLARLGARGLDAGAIRDASQRLDEAMPDLAGAAGLAVNPHDMIQFTAAVQNPNIPPGYRVEWLYEGWAGLCANPWELLTGPSPERRTAMLAAADVMVDVPRARDLATLGGIQWELGAGLGLTGLRREVVERGPWGLLWRIRMCAGAL
jgi:serine/threonine protein kinase